MRTHVGIRSAARRRIFVKVCASSVAGRRNVAWSTTVTGVTSGPAASIEVGCFIDGRARTCVKLLPAIPRSFDRAQSIVVSAELIIKQSYAFGTMSRQDSARFRLRQ